MSAPEQKFGCGVVMIMQEVESWFADWRWEIREVIRVGVRQLRVAGVFRSRRRTLGWGLETWSGAAAVVVVVV